MIQKILGFQKNKLVLIFLGSFLFFGQTVQALTFDEIVAYQNGGKVLGVSTGIDFTLSKTGLATLTYNGQSYINTIALSFSATFQTPGGVTSNYSNNASASACSLASNTISCNFRVGQTDAYSAQVTYIISDSNTLKADASIINKDSQDTLVLGNVGYILPLVMPGQITDSSGANLSTVSTVGQYGIPVQILNGSWGSLAYWLSDYTMPVSVSGDFRNNTATPGWNYSNRLTIQNNTFNGGYVANQPIAAGQTLQLPSVNLRFGSSGDTDLSLAPDAYANFRTSFPYLINWPDRRPVARWFMAEGNAHSSVTNPRGYFSDTSLDVTNQAKFSSTTLIQTDALITRLNAMNPRPQGVLIWDLEGQEFGQPFTYVGYPNKLHDMAPEMDAVADQVFSKLTAAGYKPGITLRPSNFLTGTTLPATCHFDSVNFQLSDIFIKNDDVYPNRGYQCTAPNTWTKLGARKPNWQTMSNDDNVLFQTLESKVSYARNRWGVKMFYVDSTVYTPSGGPFSFNVFRRLQQEFPDSIFFPENEGVNYYGASAPYNQANMNIFYANSQSTKIYPQAFAFIESHNLNFSTPGVYTNVVNSIKAGNIWTIDGWFNNSYDANILQAYRDAASGTISPTPTPTPTPVPTPTPSLTPTPSPTPPATLTPTPTPVPTTVPNLTPTPIVTTTPIVPAITPGTNTSLEVPGSQLKLINQNGTLYIIQNGQRQGVTNPGMLSTFGLTFNDAKPATAEDQAVPEGSLLLPADGSLVKSKQDKTVYLISNQKRYGFVSEKVFTSLGHKFKSVLVVTDPELQALPRATNLADPAAAHLPGFDIQDNGAVYWIGYDNHRHLYSSVSTYNSWHIANDFSRVVPANAADKILPIGYDVSARVVAK